MQLPIPWKQEPPHLHDNNEMAHKRLVSIRETLDRDNRDELYDVEINMMLINGYAEHVPPDKLDVAPLKWYTPHYTGMDNLFVHQLLRLYVCVPCPGYTSISARRRYQRG